MHFPTDEDVLHVALESIGLIEASDARVLWIKNTLDLGEFEASTAYLDMAEMRDNLDILVGPRQLELGPEPQPPAHRGFRPQIAGNNRRGLTAAADRPNQHQAHQP